MSEICTRTVPGLLRIPITATSPSSIRFAVTTPSIGATTRVFLSESCAPANSALACSTRRSAARTAASAVFTAVLAWS